MGWNKTDLPEHYQRQIDQQLHGKNNHHPPGMGSAEPQHDAARALASGSSSEVLGMGSSLQSHRVTIVMYRTGKLDTDNKWAAPKALLDGLVTAELIPGDSECQIDYCVEQVQVRTRAEIKTVITIEEIAS